MRSDEGSLLDDGGLRVGNSLMVRESEECIGIGSELT